MNPLKMAIATTFVYADRMVMADLMIDPDVNRMQATSGSRLPYNDGRHLPQSH